MKRKTVSGVMLTLLSTSVLTLAFNVQPARSDWTWTETIFIFADGRVSPQTAPISTVDNITYTLTDNIIGAAQSAIVVERDSILIDGVDFTLQGSGALLAIPSEGISLSGRSNVTIKNMKIRSFSRGIFLNTSSNNIISGSTITDNWDGISLSYSSNHNNMYNNTITKNECSAVELYHSLDNGISGNSVTNNGNGIYLDRSSNNVIIGNKITNNEDGIFLYKSSNNSVYENSITANHWSGITIAESSGNTIVGNNIGANAWIGIHLSGSPDNIIYHNNFVDNMYQVSADNSTNNMWDDGYPSGGNHWSDHVCTGNPSDGSQPYITDENNIDHYPFQVPNGWLHLGDINNDGIVDIFDVVRIAMVFGSTFGDPNWNPDADLNNDSVIDIFDVVILAKNFGKTA